MSKIYHYSICISNYAGKLNVNLHKNEFNIIKETEKCYMLNNSSRVLKERINKFLMTPCNYLSKLVDADYYTTVNNDEDVKKKVINQLKEVIGKVKSAFLGDFKQIVQDIDNICTEAQINAFNGIDYDYEEKEIYVDIEGDWKHSHSRFDYLVKEYFKKQNIKADISQEEIGQSDCDWYCATHTIKIVF